jgi:hypothetical protein
MRSCLILQKEKKNQTEIAKKARELGSKHMEEQIQFNGQFELIEQCKDVSMS